MILADKITEERKKNGWSQEELANQLGVSSHTNQRKESRDSSARTIYGRFGPDTETLSGTMV